MAEIEPDTFGPAGAVVLKLEFMQHCGSFPGRTVPARECLAIVLCGANTDPSDLA